MNCTFKPETLPTEIGALNCPVCGMLVIPGVPHPDDVTVWTDSELEKLATGRSEHEDWIEKHKDQIIKPAS